MKKYLIFFFIIFANCSIINDNENEFLLKNFKKFASHFILQNKFSSQSLHLEFFEKLKFFNIKDIFRKFSIKHCDLRQNTLEQFYDECKFSKQLRSSFNEIILQNEPFSELAFFNQTILQKNLIANVIVGTGFIKDKILCYLEIHCILQKNLQAPSLCCKKINNLSICQQCTENENNMKQINNAIFEALNNILIEQKSQNMELFLFENSKQQKFWQTINENCEEMQIPLCVEKINKISKLCTNQIETNYYQCIISELMEQEQLACAICQCSRIISQTNQMIDECFFHQNHNELFLESSPISENKHIQQKAVKAVKYSTSAWCIFVAELIGSLIFQLFAQGANATFSLEKTKGQHAGWFGNNFCWGLGIMMAIYTVGWASGAHLNPAVSLALCIIEKAEWKMFPFYWMGQFLGWFLGGIIISVMFYPHFQDTEIFEVKRGVFVTCAQYERKHIFNFLSEFICTFMLLFCILGINNDNNQINNNSNGILVGLLLGLVQLALGGSAGASMNPARDIGPRLAFWVMFGRKDEKGDMQWWYAALNFVAPLLGGMAAAGLYQGSVNYFD